MDAETAAAREITPEEMEDLILWLTAHPPYEMVGRIICEAARLELGLIHCAVLAGISPDRVAKMRTSDIIKELRKSKHAAGPAQADPDLLGLLNEQVTAIKQPVRLLWS